MAKQPQFIVRQSFDFWEAKNKIIKTLEAVDISGSTKERLEEKRAESSMSKTGTRKRSGPSRHLAELKKCAVVDDIQDSFEECLISRKKKMNLNISKGGLLEKCYSFLTEECQG